MAVFTSVGITMDVLLSGLLDKTNAVRRSAETYFFAQVGTSDQALTAMCLQLADHLNTSITALESGQTGNESHRVMCSVLLLRLLEEHTGNWAKIPAESQANLKGLLLAAFTREPKQHVQKRIARTIAEVAATAGGEGCKDWSEVLMTTFKMTQDSNPSARAMGLYMFRHLAEYNGDILLAPHAERLFPVMQLLLNDEDNAVRVAAMRGTIALITSLDDKEVASVQAASQNIVPELFLALQKALVCDEDAATDGLVALIDLLKNDPAFLRPYIVDACNCMLTITRAESFDDSTRKLGLEFLVCLGEYAGETLRKMPDVIVGVVQLSLQFLCLVEEDPMWHTGSGEDDPLSLLGDESDDDYSERVAAGAAALNRLSFGVGGKCLWSVLSEQIAPLLTSADWKHRRAALLATSLVSEGCGEALAPQLASVVEGAAVFVRDPHPRVRHAAVKCISGLTSRRETLVGAAIDKLQTIQDAAGSVILPAIIEAMSPALNGMAPRTRAVAARAAMKLTTSKDCQAENLDGFERPLLEALYGILTDVPQKQAREDAITAVGFIAKAIGGDKFREFYPTFIGVAKNLIAASGGKEHSRIRGYAFRCVALITQAVGVEVAGPDAIEALNGILASLSSGTVEDVEDDPTGFEEMVTAITEFAGKLGEQFVPYLQYVVPLLLQHATKEVSLEILQEGLTAGDDEKEDEEGSGGKRQAEMEVTTPDGFTRTAVYDADTLRTRVTALRGISTLLESLDSEAASLSPFVVEVTKALVSSLQAAFSSLRSTAAKGLVHCVNTALYDLANPATAQQVFDVCLDGLLAAIRAETVNSVQSAHNNALVSIVTLSYASLTDGFACTAPSIPVSKHVMEAVSAKAAERAKNPIHHAAAGGQGSRRPHTVCVLPEDRLLSLLHVLRVRIASGCRACADVFQQLVSNPDADEEYGNKLVEELARVQGEAILLSIPLSFAIKTHRAAILPDLSKTIYPVLMPFLTKKHPIFTAFQGLAKEMCETLVACCAAAELEAVLPSLLPELAKAGIPVAGSSSQSGAGAGAGQ